VAAGAHPDGVSHAGLVSAANAPGAKRTRVRADLLERAGERRDVGVGEVAREVLFDPMPVVAAGLLHRVAALVGEHDEDRAAVVLGTNRRTRGVSQMTVASAERGKQGYLLGKDEGDVYR
jgi:hypothetical protein